MPWDPKPVPESKTATSSQTSTPLLGYTGMQARAPSNIGRIKTEPDLDTSSTQANGLYMHQAAAPGVAAALAASNVASKFGDSANASVGKIMQQTVTLPGGQASEQVFPPGLQAQPGSQAPSQPQVKSENVPYSQTDGAGDATNEWHDMEESRRRATAASIKAHDDMLQRAIRHSDNGLMLPLEKHERNAAHMREQAGRSFDQTSLAEPHETSRRVERTDLDGTIDDDAINSDLDSPDEDDALAQDEDDMQSMLCTYDKVVRVKNKWKCTLKDGILVANGKE